MWRLAVTLPDDDVPEYRYCVVVVLRPLVRGDPQHVIVRRWETHILPRRAHSQGSTIVCSFVSAKNASLHMSTFKTVFTLQNFLCAVVLVETYLHLALPSHTSSPKSDLER